jgi:hypothetical protein
VCARRDFHRSRDGVGRPGDASTDSSSDAGAAVDNRARSFAHKGFGADRLIAAELRLAGTVRVGGAAVGLQAPGPRFGGGELSPEGAGGSGEASPLIILALFGLGAAGIELVTLAIRRELKMRRRSATPDSGP